jgi:hypothetical protein
MGVSVLHNMPARHMLVALPNYKCTISVTQPDTHESPIRIREAFRHSASVSAYSVFICFILSRPHIHLPWRLRSSAASSLFSPPAPSPASDHHGSSLSLTGFTNRTNHWHAFPEHESQIPKSTRLDFGSSYHDLIGGLAKPAAGQGAHGTGYPCPLHFRTE